MISRGHKRSPEDQESFFVDHLVVPNFDSFRILDGSKLIRSKGFIWLRGDIILKVSRNAIEIGNAWVALSL